MREDPAKSRILPLRLLLNGTGFCPESNPSPALLLAGISGSLLTRRTARPGVDTREAA